MSAAPAGICRSLSTPTCRRRPGPSPIVASGGPFDGQSLTTPIFTGARPNPNFGRISTVSDVVESNYNGLVLQLNRRLTKGLQFQASYTEARATDNGQTLADLHLGE